MRNLETEEVSFLNEIVDLARDHNNLDDIKDQLTGIIDTFANKFHEQSGMKFIRQSISDNTLSFLALIDIGLVWDILDFVDEYEPVITKHYGIKIIFYEGYFNPQHMLYVDDDGHIAYDMSPEFSLDEFNRVFTREFLKNVLTARSTVSLISYGSENYDFWEYIFIPPPMIFAPDHSLMACAC